MAFDLRVLERGCFYTRPELARLWGYADFHAFSKGVFTPRKSGSIVLFVTRVKQTGLTPYQDHISGDLLYWEGEKQHRTDRRIARAAQTGEGIYLFYRDVHHTPFRYYGQVLLNTFIARSDKPSSFIFEMAHNMSVVDDLRVCEDDLLRVSETERGQLIKARVGQGNFRDSLIRDWRGCSITGIDRPDLIRASHIKPWRLSNNEERLNPFNGLLLLPQYDHLFDAGYITFGDDGGLIRSVAIAALPQTTLGIEVDARLRRITDVTENSWPFIASIFSRGEALKANSPV